MTSPTTEQINAGCFRTHGAAAAAGFLFLDSLSFVYRGVELTTRFIGGRAVFTVCGDTIQASEWLSAGGLDAANQHFGPFDDDRRYVGEIWIEDEINNLRQPGAYVSACHIDRWLTIIGEFKRAVDESLPAGVEAGHEILNERNRYIDTIVRAGDLVRPASSTRDEHFRCGHVVNGREHKGWIEDWDTVYLSALAERASARRP